MAIWNTSTHVRNDLFEGEQFARVEADTHQEAKNKVEAALQDLGWETSDTFAREK
ncbi:hypothetical protein ACFWRZ_07985 [Streptomyces rubiginosohelvolus]|uniref:hypothetical protein n=1 Tax=Streptomyces rubiginosohelvolus TaxID=67362 RepID=UPI003659DF7B